MPVKIMIDPDKVVARVMNVFNQDVLPALSEEILADCNEYCKEDNHILIDSSIEKSKPEKGLLIWETPYAKRQYWEIKTSLTPGRTWKWCETAKRRWCKTKWSKKAERGLKDNL